MQPPLTHLSLLVADAILAGSSLEGALKVPAFPSVRHPLKQAHRHRRRAHPRTPSRKEAPSPPNR